MTETEARMIAAQAWCFPETGHLSMDTRLCEAFAKILLTQDERLKRVAGVAARIDSEKS